MSVVFQLNLLCSCNVATRKNEMYKTDKFLFISIAVVDKISLSDEMAKLYFLCALTVFSVGFVVGSPIVRPLPPTKSTRNYTNEEIHPFPSCSMKITSEQAKSGIIDGKYQWKDGFAVHPDQNFTEDELEVINDALHELSQILCIPVLMWPQNSNPTGDYVEIMRGGSGSGCWSYVGRHGGKQEMNLQSNGCIQKFIVIHEAIHALGYYHEQSRSDRDEHVLIFWDNIVTEFQYSFYKFEGTTTFDVPYDLKSIMQYSSWAFSKNRQPTILGKNGSRIPVNTVMTKNDVAKLQKMYNCWKKIK